MNRRHLFQAAALTIIPQATRAHSFKHGKIAIGHAWALPVQHGDGQVFFPLLNNGDDRDELLAARSNVCSLVELRRNNRYDDPALETIVLEPGRPVPMRPTALHLRLVAIRKPLVLGERLALILDFLNSGEAQIEVFVEEQPGN